jgi:hypothetical protein
LSVLIRVLGDALGGDAGGDAGQYLKAYDPAAEDGRGLLVTTTDPAEAKRYSAAEALAEWKRVSRVRPRRPDGKPNRPLSAFTIEIVRAPEP